MATWTRKPQEREGDYQFDGQILATAGVNAELSRGEIQAIYNDTRQFVRANRGADYLQVYTDENERKIFFIDDKTHCTILFAHEY